MDGAALLMPYGHQDQFQKQESDIGSSLAFKLQQVVLRHKIQPQQQEHENHGLGSYGFDPPQQAAEVETGYYLEDSAMEIEADPLGDPVFNYISDMVTDEGCLYDHRTCMFIDSSGYAAMAKNYQPLSEAPVMHPGFAAQQLHNQELHQQQENFQEFQIHQKNQQLVELEQQQQQIQRQQQQQQQQNNSLEQWVDGLFAVEECEPPCPATSATSKEAYSDSDEVFRDKLHGFLGEVQSDIEKNVKSSSPSSSTVTSQPPEYYSDGQQEYASPVPVKSSSSLPAKSRKRNGKDEVDLCSLLVECAEALADRELANKTKTCSTPDPWWSGDLQKNEFVSGSVRNVEVDNEAVEAEKKLKVELHGLLVECARAVAADEMTKAYQIVNGIRDRVSPRGNGTQRMVFYFAESLVARITGTGALLYGALASQKPPLAEMLKAYMLISRYLPNVRLCHYFMNQTILDSTEGASRIHIVDYGIMYGFQWPCLMKALASRPGGAPHLRITGIDFPQPGFKPAERIEETGRKLAEYARHTGVPFEFHALATAKWEGVQPSSLFLRHDEVLIVNSTFRLRHLLDESVMVDSPRKLVLSRIRSMKPKVFVESVVSANYNAPFFLTRFKEALLHYSAIFDAIDTTVSPEFPERHLIEQSIMGREILNVIACEGVERVERAESYKQWQSRTQKAGFEQLPLKAEIFTKARAMMNTYHKGFGIGQDGNWLLLGWKERILHAMSTWKT